MWIATHIECVRYIAILSHILVFVLCMLPHVALTDKRLREYFCESTGGSIL